MRRNRAASASPSASQNISEPPPSANVDLNESFVVSGRIRTSELYDGYSSGSPCSTDDEGASGPLDLRKHLHKWYCESGANLTQLNLLLDRLRMFYPELPSDASTVVGTPRQTGEIKILKTGTYIHLGFEKYLKSKLSFGVVNSAVTTLKLDIGIDGVRLAEGSDLQSWPILARSLDLVDSAPFCIGIFTGYGKPDPLDSYLEDFVGEVQNLLSDGLEVNGKHYSECVEKFVCDAPARAGLKCIKHHTGFSACERCDMEGEHINYRHIYEPKVATLRTNESFRLQTDENHHTGVSPLSVLPIDFVSMFVLDPMHLLYHGVFKRFLHFITKECKTGARLRASEIGEISSKLENMVPFIPCCFQRKPKSLQTYPRWKGTELRLCLLYTVVVAFRGIVRDELYELILLLHVGSRIISSPKYVKVPGMVDFAERLFAAFVETASHPSVLGRLFVVYNVHSLLHLCDDVRRFGDINVFSAFPFENHLGLIKRMLRSGVKTFQPPEVPPEHFIFNGYSAETKSYKSISNARFEISPNPAAESYFIFNDNCLGSVKKILKTSSGAKLVADVCEDLKNFYTSPDESKKFGVYLLEKWTSRDVEVSVDSINAKCLVLPLDSHSGVAFVLLHTLH